MHPQPEEPVGDPRGMGVTASSSSSSPARGLRIGVRSLPSVLVPVVEAIAPATLGSVEGRRDS